MLDHEQRIARGPQFEQHLQQLGDVMKMQTGGRLIENVEGAAGRFAGQFRCQFDPLSLATT